MTLKTAAIMLAGAVVIGSAATALFPAPASSLVSLVCGVAFGTFVADRGW